MFAVHVRALPEAQSYTGAVSVWRHAGRVKFSRSAPTGEAAWRKYSGVSDLNDVRMLRNIRSPHLWVRKRGPVVEFGLYETVVVRWINETTCEVDLTYGSVSTYLFARQFSPPYLWASRNSISIGDSLYAPHQRLELRKYDCDGYMVWRDPKAKPKQIRHTDPAKTRRLMRRFKPFRDWFINVNKLCGGRLIDRGTPGDRTATRALFRDPLNTSVYHAAAHDLAYGGWGYEVRPTDSPERYCSDWEVIQRALRKFAVTCAKGTQYDPVYYTEHKNAIEGVLVK